MSEYIAAYDIRYPSQRAKIARVLLAYGLRIQQSVYHIELEPDEIPQLKRRIGALLSLEDKFDLLPVDTRENRIRLAWQQAPSTQGQVVIM